MAGFQRPGVYISERLLTAPIAAGPSADAAGAVVAALPYGPSTVTRVTSWYEFVKTFGGYNKNYPATFQASLFFQNGGRELYVKRVLHSDAAAAAATIVKSGGSDPVFSVTAKNKGAQGNNLRAVVSAGSAGDGYYTLSIYQEGASPATSSSVADDVLIEKYENVVLDDAASSDYIETVINLVSPTIVVDVTGGDFAPTTAVVPLTGGSDGTSPTKADYVPDLGDDVFAEFSIIDRPLVVFIPGIVDTLGTTDAAEVYNAATAWAESAGTGFVVMETLAGQTVDQAISFATGLTDSSNAAVYFPQAYIADPLGRSAGALRKVGLSGAVAGLYLATDAARGVFKAPAGLGSAIQGIVATEKPFTSAELDKMNSASAPLNPVRQVPGNGFVVMGARTLKQDGTANKYVNMRRSLIYLRKRLKNITEFALFENNDSALWGRLNTAITAFLTEYKNQGGLAGATPAQAFFVKVDGENNTATAIANGEVHIEVGVALQYPAEFIVINLSQKTLN